MAYKVFISTGKKGTKNYTSMGSTPLKNKQAVVNWVKRNPVGNYKTQVSVENTRTKKIITGQKIRFKSLRFW